MRTVALFLMLAMLELSIISSARKLLLDYLRGGTSKKSFRRVSQSQPFWQKATLQYVRGCIREPAFLRPFQFYASAYFICAALIPCKVFALALGAGGILPWRQTALGLILCCVAEFALFQWEAPGKRHSRYAGRKYQEKK